MIIYLYKYKNYYNRQVNKHDTPGQYESAGAELIAGFPNITFNPNDGIQTELIVNYDGQRIPDYLLACSKATDIESRWYVIEAARVREGQYKLSLLRDVVCDYYEAVVSAPCFIEKASLPTSTSLIYNNENFGFSQIKKLEIPIDDASHTPWYALYINKDVAGTQLTFDSGRIVPDIIVSDLDQYEYYNYQDTNHYKAEFADLVYTATIYSARWFTGYPPYVSEDGYTIDTEEKTITMCFDGTTAPCNPLLSQTWHANAPTPFALTDGAGITGNGWSGKPGSYQWNAPQDNYAIGAAAFQGELYRQYPVKSYSNLFKTLASDYLGVQNNPNIYNSENGKIIKVANTNRYYKVKVERVKTDVKEITVANETSPYQHLISVMTALGNGSVQGNSPFSIQYKLYEYKFSFIPLDEGTATINLPSTREHCKDEVYDIIMFPMESIKLQRGATIYQTDERFNKQVLSQLMLTIPKEKLYDVQLLPYVPIADSRFYDDGTGTTTLELSETAFIEDEDFSIVSVSSKTFFMYYPSVASFTKSLTRPELQVAIPADPIEFKLENESKLFRLSSPNYNGAFEFSAAKNRGILGYNITCSYRPYNPYIKVAPIFRGLYGQDFGDARGLICGGDFSISQMTDQFASYELQNKNYQQMFDREIKYMEDNNAIQHQLDIINAATGALSGGINAGISGAMVGGPIGLGIGAVAGAALSGVAGYADVKLNEKIRNLSLDYTKDQFGYQLGNIKALPYNITKVSSRNADNKIFPFLEVYGATAAEEEAYRNKLKWNGMTVMAIGSIGEYLQSEPTFIKGKIIRFTRLNEEFHMANFIADEINKGVYI